MNDNPAIDELIPILDEQFRSWDVWRTYDKRWVVQVRDDKSTHDGHTMLEAFRAAAAYRVLPRIPRRPELLLACEYTPIRDGNRWRAERNGQVVYILVQTKREVLEFAERMEKQSTAAIAEWDVKYGAIVAKGTEGVDFRWDD